MADPSPRGDLHGTAAHDRAFFGHRAASRPLLHRNVGASVITACALLILFMTAPITAGGLGFSTAVSGAIYGLYTSMVT
jgi:hypothetical protein